MLRHFRFLHPQHKRLRNAALAVLEMLPSSAEKMAGSIADHYSLHPHHLLVLAHDSMDCGPLIEPASWPA
jgi:hypothetical protein